ncbi:MAG TPA: ketoacyl-ACP synthase III [Byssovorax sp.]|jgi:3-oxoacyl-[acyl-carrier-protein] synthase-3
MLFFHGLGHFHPENQIDNAFLESLDIGTNEKWILDRVGITGRRTVLPLDYIRATKNQDLRGAQEAALYTNAQTGARAARMAIERAGITPADVGMIIAGDCSPDNCIPAEASRIGKELGLRVPCFDMQSACSTFGMQAHFVSQLGDNAPDYVLLVSPENTTRITNFADRSSAILFGDATSAAVVSTKVPSRARVAWSTFGANPEGCDEVVIPRLGHFYQNGSAVQKFAIKQMSALLAEIQAAVGPDRAHRVHYVGHQANLTMLEAVCRRCEIPEDRHHFNIVDFGNQAAAGAPVVLSQHWDRFGAGDVAAVVVVGSGLSWSALRVEFS